MKEAQKLLGVPTIGGGVLRQRVVALKFAQNAVFPSKVLNKIYSQDVFLRNTLILKFFVT